MQRLSSLVLVLLVFLANGTVLASAKDELGDKPVKDDVIPNQYIVVLDDDAQTPNVDEKIVTLSKAHKFTRTQTYYHSLYGFAAELTSNEAEKLRRNPDVKMVVQDRTVFMYAQTVPTGVRRVGAQQTATHMNKGTGVNVAVIDTGIDTTHPDLSANIAGGRNCVGGNKNAYKDGNGHGTHVAGTIAARDNTIGVVGVAPEAKLWSVRVLNNQGSGTWSQVICGIDFVTSKAPGNGGPITVANMSLGGSGSSDNNCGYTNNDPLHQAICRSRDKGVTYIVAAGNGDSNGNGINANLSVPSAYNDAVITVSALADSDGLRNGIGAATSYGPDDTFATFSNYGSVVDIGAPGVSIYSTYKGNVYATLSGTSMASPHAAGAAALYIKNNPGATWTQVRDALAAIGEMLGAGHTDPSGLHPENILDAVSL